MLYFNILVLLLTQGDHYLKPNLLSVVQQSLNLLFNFSVEVHNTS